MRQLSWLLAAGSMSLTVLAYAGGGRWETLQARYLIHSETATYPEAATKEDRVIAVVIDGKAAKELFDLTGPDFQPSCTLEKGDRARRKKGVECIYTAVDAKSQSGPYRCWIGLNLNTGDGDVRVSC